MSTTLNIAGCRRLGSQILEYLKQLLQCAMANDHAKSREFASKIVYDGENLREFIPEKLRPQWLTDAIEKCKAYRALSGGAAEFAKHAIVINDILFELKIFKWESLEITTASPNLDAEFSQYTAAMHLDNALEKLIDCLKIIQNEPAFNLNRKTKVDIETVISGLRTPNASESAIRSWLFTAGELVKLCIPHMDKIEKTIELLRKTEAAYDEACMIIFEAKKKIGERLISEFCLEDQLSPRLSEAETLSLQLPCAPSEVEEPK